MIQYTTTHVFKKQTEIPFEYVCGSCGRTVSGKRPLSTGYEYRKTAGSEAALALTEEERAKGEATVERALRKELRFYKEETEKKRYAFLADYKECPFCHKEQKWAYSSKKGWLQLLIGSAAVVLGALFLYFSYKSGFFSNDLGLEAFILGAVCAGGGLLAVAAGIIELSLVNSVKGLKEQLPVLRFPE